MFNYLLRQEAQNDDDDDDDDDEYQSEAEVDIDDSVEMESNAGPGEDGTGDVSMGGALRNADDKNTNAQISSPYDDANVQSMPPARHLFGSTQNADSVIEQKDDATLTTGFFNPNNSNDDDAAAQAFEDEDQTINTKLAMHDLGLMFGSPSAEDGWKSSSVIEDSKSCAKAKESKPLFSVFNEFAEEDGDGGAPNGATYNDNDTASMSVLADIVNMAVPRKITNADVARSICIQGLQAAARGDEYGADHDDDDNDDDDEQEEEEEDRTSLKFEVYCDVTETIKGDEGHVGFQIFNENENENDAAKSEAGFEIFDDGQQEGGDENANNITGFSDYVDRDHNTTLGESPNLSRIVELEHTVEHMNETTSVSCCDARSATEASYHDVYDGFVESSFGIALALERSFVVCDSRTDSIPRSIKPGSTVEFKASSKGRSFGTKRGQDGTMFVVKQQLGKGSNASVFLIEHAEGGENATSDRLTALKVQKPVGCLTWEYLVLRKLEERLSDEGYFIPRPLSLHVFSDGAALSMTLPTSSPAFYGKNLVDVVNAHAKVGLVPELVAIHYTVLMLKYIETLHSQGKMLHCDVKPDNWVVCPGYATANHDDTGVFIEGADLKLIDFGRAVDIEGKISVKLTGNAAGEDMQSAAMRDDRPWSIDVDTFGISASSHALLFGTHLEISQDVSGRWRTMKSIRRYWQGELWQRFFDTLLNSGGSNGTGCAVGSSAEDLRGLRSAFEAYLHQEAKQKEIKALLKFQASMMSNA